MIAAASRNVVTDRVDMLIRIGLGKRGRVNEHYREMTGLTSFQADLVLAKYTCVALQRLSGSVKKVKGT